MKNFSTPTFFSGNDTPASVNPENEYADPMPVDFDPEIDSFLGLTLGNFVVDPPESFLKRFLSKIRLMLTFYRN